MIQLRPFAAALAALVLISSAQADTADKVQTYRRYLAQGRKLLKASDWPGAANEFRKAREVLPRDWRGHAFQAVAHIQEAVQTTKPDRRQGLLQQAGVVAADLPKRAGTRMTDPMYLYLRGVIMSAQNRDVAAFETLQRVVNAQRAALARYEDLQLAANAKMAFAQASLKLAGRMMTNGEFEKTVPILERANQGLEAIPNSKRVRALLARRLGVACEQISNYEPAIRYLRQCVELSESRKIEEELTAAIALIQMNLERLAEGRKTLEALGEKTSHPEVVAAQCMLRYKLAMRAPDEPVMDEALGFIRARMKDFPVRERYFLAKLIADLVIEKVPPADAAEHRDLLLGVVQLLKLEAEHRPECPGVYFRLRRLYQLLGDQKKELYHDRLYAAKKRDFDQKQKYDQNGRPRCR